MHHRTLALVCFAALTQITAALAQGTAFTYQGRLQTNGVPYTGSAEFQFTLWDAASAGTTIAANNTPSIIAPVENGLFTVTLDFGVTAFNGQPRFLQIDARTTLGPFTTLNPRQPLTSTPYALRSLNVQPGGLATGTYTNAAVFNNPANAFSGSGAGLTGLNASQLTGGTVPAAALSNAWRLGGNAGTTPGISFLGTTDNQPLELRVNSQAALRLLPNSTSPNLVGGHSANFVNPDGAGAFIGGGGGAGNLNVASGNYAAVVGGYQNSSVGVGTFIGGGSTNRATGTASFVGGGTKNRAVNEYSTVAGGNNNWATGPFSAVAGGNFNTAEGTNSIIAGGFGNVVLADAGFLGGGFANLNSGERAVLVGGESNTVTNDHGTVGGGFENFVGGRGGVIAGGYDNTNTGAYSVLGGGNFNMLRGSYSTIGGGRSNFISAPLAQGVTIGGGMENYAISSFATIGGGRRNVVNFPAVDSVIGGGRQNIIDAASTLPSSGTIGGGETNRIHDSSWATIGGGINNSIDTFGSASTVGGGSQNSLEAAGVSSIAGGFHNQVGPGGGFITGGSIGGGVSNVVRSSYATVPGGIENEANAFFSLAAGRRAKANHPGSFVWADDQNADFASTANRQFAVRADNGVVIQAASTALELRGGGALKVVGAGVNSATPVFTHRAAPVNIAGAETRIDHPLCNGRSDAILIITYNFNPAGGAGTRNDRPFGLYYTGSRWAIYNLDGTAMPVGAAYNVLVFNP